MEKATVGIIGGTGLSDVLIKEAGGKTVAVETPFGPPSSNPIVANWEGVDVAFLSRHGPEHMINPSAVPYRANIWALKTLGVSAIIASGATGSLREDIEPGHLVLCDQVIDKTCRRESTFFNEGLVVHVEFGEPFCRHLRRLLAGAGERVDVPVHHAGTYVCMEGPQFSTRAESHMHRQWGGDLVGMTCMPEAKLAREAEMCYALVALPTDYDCWRPADPSRSEDVLLKEILGNLRRATDNAISLIHEALKLMDNQRRSCRCHEALKLAIWSDKAQIDAEVRRRLDLLIGRYVD
ncbi:MAG: S-methyl-5'-thioadenosine phosphorylase [Phycisphaerales bacterium]|nr:MAG: S-methyl-5'-thioadenosine phosphorylase [Phycisphaerales bacterium]